MLDSRALSLLLLSAMLSLVCATCGGLAVIDPDGPPSGTSSTTSSGGSSSTASTSTTTTATSSTSTSTTTTTTSTVVCDVGDCAVCLDSECLANHCAAAIDACQMSAECVALDTCVEACQDSYPGCIQQCKQTYPEGVAPLFGMYDCILCEACFVDCVVGPDFCPYEF